MKAFQTIKSLFQKKSDQPSTSRSPRASSPILSRSASASSLSSTQSLACVATEENSTDWSELEKLPFQPVTMVYNYHTESDDTFDNVPLLGGIPRPERSECGAVEQKFSQLAQKYDKQRQHNAQKVQEAKENLSTEHLTGFWIRSHTETRNLQRKYVDVAGNHTRLMAGVALGGYAQLAHSAASAVQERTGSKGLANAAGVAALSAMALYHAPCLPLVTVGLAATDIFVTKIQPLNETYLIQELDKEDEKTNGSYVRVTENTENEVPIL